MAAPSRFSASRSVHAHASSLPCCPRACASHEETPSFRSRLVGSAFLRSILVLVVLAAAGRRLLPAHAPGPAAPEGRGQGEVHVLLAVHPHQEGGDVADLLADA